VLADQNVREAVVEYLRDQRFDVVSAREGDLPGSSDESLYALAIETRRIVLTHDRDFGRLARFADEHPPGIVYLRPGHLDTAFTIAQVATLLANDPEVEEPFMVVAEQRPNRLDIRIRSLSAMSDI
jgi:predicted nuclease of predicted toxin-antitoxin system